MEKLKVKHDHTLTDIIKVGIFAVFLILPLLVFAPNAFYYGFNEHADNGTPTYETNIERKYTTNDLTNFNDLKVGNTYLFEFNYVYNKSSYNNNYSDIQTNNLYDNTDRIYPYSSISLSTYNFSPSTIKVSAIDGVIYTKYQASSSYISKINIGNTEYDGITLTFSTNNLTLGRLNSVGYYIANNQNMPFTYLVDTTFGNSTYYPQAVSIRYAITFTNLETNLRNSQYVTEAIETGVLTKLPDQYNTILNAEINISNENSITNAMGYAWQQTWELPIFNWTGNNNFAFTINAMSNVFGISQNSYIANYINYLLTLTAIYVIFDIVIAVFVKLTHMFHE